MQEKTADDLTFIATAKGLTMTEYAAAAVTAQLDQDLRQPEFRHLIEQHKAPKDERRLISFRLAIEKAEIAREIATLEGYENLSDWVAMVVSEYITARIGRDQGASQL